MSLKSLIKLAMTLPPPPTGTMDSSITKTSGDDKFEDLEITYGILLGSIAAIFIVVCIVAWLWYYRTKINLSKSQGWRFFEDCFIILENKF